MVLVGVPLRKAWRDVSFDAGGVALAALRGVKFCGVPDADCFGECEMHCCRCSFGFGLGSELVPMTLENQFQASAAGQKAGVPGFVGQEETQLGVDPAVGSCHRYGDSSSRQHLGRSA